MSRIIFNRLNVFWHTVTFNINLEIIPMKQIFKMTINGSEVDFEQGKTVLEICQDKGIAIPTLCHDARLKPYGGCRLCIVEVAGAPKPLTSCTTPAAEGMQVTTESPRLTRLRKTIIELLLSKWVRTAVGSNNVDNCARV
jgi:predicted molibdopterin-dependent oxidoreductase YjgC